MEKLNWHWAQKMSRKDDFWQTNWLPKKKRTYLNSYCSSNKDLLGFSANREICHVLALRRENFRGGFVSPLCNQFKEFLWYFTFNFSFGFNEMVLGEVSTSQWDIPVALYNLFWKAAIELPRIIYELPKYQIQRLQSVQNCAARLFKRFSKFDYISLLLFGFHWLPV